LSDFTRIGNLTLSTGEDYKSAVIHPASGFAYFGTGGSSSVGPPSVVVQVGLSNFIRVGALTLNPGENHLLSAIIDPVAGLAYFGTYISPGIVVKVDVGPGRSVGGVVVPIDKFWLISPYLGIASLVLAMPTLLYAKRLKKAGLRNRLSIGYLRN
jgi:hypothetical protein